MHAAMGFNGASLPFLLPSLPSWSSQLPDTYPNCEQRDPLPQWYCQPGAHDDAWGERQYDNNAEDGAHKFHRIGGLQDARHDPKGRQDDYDDCE